MGNGFLNEGVGSLAPAGQADKPRNVGIDLFRGLLVVLVVLGHFAELTQRQNFMTWLGFGLRMPLFIALSGYLFNLEQARTLSFVAMLRKYYARLILPWLVACVFTLTITGGIQWLSPLQILVRPPFHLWFIPVMMAFIFGARLSRLSPDAMLALAIPVSIVSMYTFGIGYNVEQFGPWMPDRRYFIYLVYFAFGMWVAQRPFNPSIRLIAWPLALIGLLWWAKLYAHPSLTAEVAAGLVLCMPLIRMFPMIQRRSLKLPLLARIGRDSLFFYLWHPLAFAIWACWGASGPLLLAGSVATMLVTWAVIVPFPRLCRVLGVQPADGSARFNPLGSRNARKAAS